MKSKISKRFIELILFFLLTVLFAGCSKDEGIIIQKHSAFIIEKDKLNVEIFIANNSSQKSKPFKVKLRVNSPEISASLGFYEKDVEKSDRSTSPFSIDPYHEMAIKESFQFNSELNEASINENTNNGNYNLIEIEVFGDGINKVFPLKKF